MGGFEMSYLFTTALVAAAFVLPLAAAAQERFPALNPDQLTPEQKAYADSIAKPPRNANFKNPPYRVYIRSPELAKRVEAVSDYGRCCRKRLRFNRRSARCDL
jgi:4-carboxymuconolactone decarboxylase